MSRHVDDEGPFEEDDIRNLIEEEYPGGWAAYCAKQEEDRLRSEYEARSPWRRLEKRIERLAYEAGIEPEMARKLVEDRLAIEIAEAVVEEFRQDAGLGAARRPQIDQQPSGVPGDERAEPPTVATPYMNVEQAAAYLKKTPKAIYGLIERGRLRKLPGSRVCYFTREMLDDFLRVEAANGRSVRPGRRKKG